ncbi:MAG: hypothetical protein A2167_07785 [Planctomycetes bacterium RBG_13_46_10]|nr:MAG: hypothetical protein A2167_07785 [Planctomycetes bacterium RBG_13_46_10]
MAEEKLVIIAKFADYIEAEMALQLLADYGIKAVATGENAANIYPIPAVEGPELQVLESQAEQARQILESHKQQDSSEEEEDKEDEEDDDDSTEPEDNDSFLTEQEQ